MEKMYLLIGADIVPTVSNVELFIKGNVKELVGIELLSLLNNAAYRIFNLEVPLANHEDPILKQGPNLIAPTSAINGYRCLGIDLFTLANNHILDQNVQGYYSTVKTLDKAGINYVGAGNNLADAERPYVFSFAEKKVGVYACAEHEFSIAKESTPGANPFDSLCSLDHVNELKQICDYVIVLYHGGKEHYQYPSPNLQKICRRLVDKGANLVICQHSHCIGCEEKFKNGTIVYGQGNFLFDYQNNEYWNTSILIKVDELFNVSYIPIIKSGNCIRRAEKEKEDEILKEFRMRSEQVTSPGFVEERYCEFAIANLAKYLNKIKGKESLLYKVVNKLFGNRLRKRTIIQKYDDKHLITLWNFIDCEAHNELFLKGIQCFIKKSTGENKKNQ